MEAEPPTTAGFWQITSYWRDRALKAEEELVTLTAIKPDPKPYAPPLSGYDFQLDS